MKWANILAAFIVKCKLINYGNPIKVMTHLLRLFTKLFYLFILTITVIIGGVLYYIEFELPNIEALNTVQLQVPLQIYSRDGKLIAAYGEKRRVPIPYDQIPKPLIDAVLATEDQRYFQHPGIDIPGLMRATLLLIATGRKEQGGSTITMQVARSFYLTRHKTFGRKLREILLALKIDHKLSKQKILELYLNKIFLGNRAYGVGAAAEIYYGKPLNQLSLDEYAMLAGLPKAPSALNPLANPDAALKRRNHVLARMYELHYINEKAYKTAIAAPLNAHYHDLYIQLKAPYAAELVRQQLEQMYGDAVYTDGFNVYTTIDSHLQKAANEAVHDNLLAYDQRHGYRGPEKNFGVPDLTTMEEWEKKLNTIPIVNGLEPGAVIDMSRQSITVLRRNGSMITVPWQGLSWARKQINADYLGRQPNKASDILKLGDIIRITQTPQGWKLAQIPKAESGLIALNPQNGEIVALVGGFDFQNSNFNRITEAQRQPGSSFKPFIYSAALNKGYTLATIVNDAPIVVTNPDGTLWRPQNVDRQFFGPTRVHDALMYSRNLVSIRLLNLTGVSYTVKYLQNFGFAPSQLPPVLSLALGTASVTPLQMAAAYSVFANGGFRIVPYAIDTIHDSKGQVIYQAKPLIACSDMQCTDPVAALTGKASETTHAPRAISAQNAFLMTSALRDVVQHGTAAAAKALGRNDLAGKTGTSQNQVDAWFAGFNSDLVAIAWTGFDQPQSLHEFGAQASLPTWMQFMQVALKGRPERTLAQPPGIVSVRINAETGQRTSSNDRNAIFEYFMTPFVPGEEGQDTTPASEAPNDTAPPSDAAPAASSETPSENGGIY
jgi:penicillin-binding protein 1A